MTSETSVVWSAVQPASPCMTASSKGACSPIVTQGLARWVEKKLLDFLHPHPAPQIHCCPQ